MSYSESEIEREADAPGSIRELFDFQDTSSRVSQEYQESLKSILANGVKVVLLSSLDDQMVSRAPASQWTGVLTLASL